MTVDEMKKIADARTKGDWKMHSGLSFGSGVTLTGVSAKKRIFRACGDRQIEDSEFAAMTSNSWEKLMAVVGAVEKIANYEDEFGAPKHGILPGSTCREIARTALKALGE